jgi:hypothetical protein
MLARERAIDPARRRDEEALHAARERIVIGRLGDQVDVRALDAEVDDANSRCAWAVASARRNA